jgi:hypothetical protein
MTAILKFIGGFIVFTLLLAVSGLWWVFTDARRYIVDVNFWKAPVNSACAILIIALMSAVGAFFPIIIVTLCSGSDIAFTTYPAIAGSIFVLGIIRSVYTTARVRLAVWKNPISFAPFDSLSAKLLGWNDFDDYVMYREWYRGRLGVDDVLRLGGSIAKWKSTMKFMGIDHEPCRLTNAVKSTELVEVIVGNIQSNHGLN